MQDKLLKILREKFKLESFRDGQEEVVQSVVDGKDTLVFMPTGGGKSLTYQLPGLCREGVVLVISPLISLMKDQVDKLKELGIRTELINSTIDSYDIQIILNDLSNPNTDIKFLYIAPERLNSNEFLRVISKINVALVAIDEAHCISQWGHDFRPSYMKIKGFLDKLRTSPPTPLLQERGVEKMGVIKNYKSVPDYVKNLSKELRLKQTDSEKFLWEILKNKKLNDLKFRRQHPFGRYIADFYCHELGLVIELDGKIHENQKEYDEIRDEIISKYGVKVLRVKNQELFNNTEKVVESIIINSPSPVGEGVRGGGFPTVALTATATKKVRADIIERLGLLDYNSFTAGFDRKNITIIVREISKKDEKIEKVLEILNKTPGSGIIYCASRKAVKELYDVLIQNGVKAGMYTGAMSPDVREKEQNAFMNDTYKVIVATNAFGMGIDKKDIRFVIHYNLPGSIENYYQEVGRAGRDGKNSFGVVIASFGDTKIQEFFIENTYPSKEEILKLYDFLYKGEKEGQGKGKVVLKTQATIAKEAGIDSDMKVGSALKILEKYNIINKGVSSSEMEEGFRGRGLTTVQEKRKHSSLLIDWNRQNLLKDEAYFKLEQIKKLLFYPTCRKRFILDYFGDEEDLATLPDNCGACDYCIEKKNLKDTIVEDFVNTSVFALVLDVVKKNDAKIGVVMMTKFLRGSQDAKIIEWNMHKKENFGALEDLSSDLIQAVIEALISQDYLYKTEGKYPLLGITDTGKVAIVRNFLLKDDNTELQHYIKIKLGSKATSKTKKTLKSKKDSNSVGLGKTDTFNETLLLLKEGKNLKEISEARELKPMTIESHVIKLYELGEIGLNDIMKYSNFTNLKAVKIAINDNLNGIKDPLKPIKEILENNGNKNISYFEIKIAIAMMDKKDI